MKAYSGQVNKNCNKSLHYNNTNYLPTTIKIVADKESKTMQSKGKIRGTLEKTRKKHLQNELPTSDNPLSSKVGALGFQDSRLNHECGGLHCEVWKVGGSIHYPIDLLTQLYATLSTP